jgi:hypothetical protein
MRSRAEHKPDLSQTAEKVYTGAIRLSRSMGNAAGRAREALPPLGALLVPGQPRLPVSNGAAGSALATLRMESG